jgi:hypothetical protein
MFSPMYKECADYTAIRKIVPVSELLMDEGGLLTQVYLALIIRTQFIRIILQASGEVLELADRHDLGSCAERRRGSSPLFPTAKRNHTKEN